MMELIKLKDLVLDMHQGINTVADKVEYQNIGIPIIQSKNITSGFLDLEDVRCLSNVDFINYREKYKPNKDDLLFCNIGTIGKSLVIEEENDFLIAWNLFLIKVNKEKLNPVYLKYYLEYLRTVNYFDRLLTGGTVKFINKKSLSEILIPIVSIEKQAEIVKSLSIAEEIIYNRQSQITALDELVQSFFLEMFGHPLNNEKNWNVMKCKDVTFKIGSGATPKGGNSAYKNSGISLIRSMNVYNNTFKYKDLAFIDEEQASKLNNVTVEVEDVLLNITGASVTRSCLVPNDILPARVNQHVSIIRADSKIIKPRFLVNLLSNKIYQVLLMQIATSGGATREAITKKQIEQLPIIVPPIDIQNRFLELIVKIEEQKKLFLISKDSLESAYNSLLQRAFKG